MANSPPATAVSTQLTLGNQQTGTLHDDEQVETEVEKLLFSGSAHKISINRSVFPDQLRSSFAAQRTQFPFLQDSGSHGESSEGVKAAEKDEETSEILRLLTEKISTSLAMVNSPPATAVSTQLNLGNQQTGMLHDDEQVEAEVEKLEEELKEMAHKISINRSVFPDQLRSSFAAQRPQFPFLQDSGSHGESSKGVRTAEKVEETGERLRLLKEKISSSHGESSKGVRAAEKVEETGERLRLLKEKISSSHGESSEGVRAAEIDEEIGAILRLLKEKISSSHGESREGVRAAEEYEEIVERLWLLLKKKISSSFSDVAQLVKKLEDCLARMDKFCSRAEVVINPAFKKQKKN